MQCFLCRRLQHNPEAWYSHDKAWYDLWNAAPFLLQICWLWPKSSILLYFKSTALVSTTHWASVDVLYTSNVGFYEGDAGLLLLTLPWRCCMWATPESAKSSCSLIAVKWGFRLVFLTSEQAVLPKSFLGLPNYILTSAVPLNFHLITFFTVETARWQGFAIFLLPSPILWASIPF